MQAKSSISILVAIRLAHASWRDFLSGFLDWAHATPNWSLRIADPADVPAIMAETVVDGLVIGDIDESVASHLTRSRVPTVVVGSQATSIAARRRNIVFLHNDDEDIGREGARILDALGVRNSYAFVPHADGTHWSDLRVRGFAAELKARGKSAAVCRLPRIADPKDAHRRLVRWLQTLPKPVAVMAACDATAVEVIELCREAKLKVPEQVAVLGVDNDRLLCETARPPLSSIAPDHFHEGELAAQALAALLRRQAARPKTVLCTQKTTVTRESTQAAKPAAILLRRAMEFIKDRAATKITSTDVARHLGVSRQLAELRFREFGERTLAATIRDIRLKEVRRQLRATKQPIRTIASNCGWANVNHLENAFKRRFGVSMRSYRFCCRPHADATSASLPLTENVDAAFTRASRRSPDQPLRGGRDRGP